jgi:hypothetical protein
MNLDARARKIVTDIDDLVTKIHAERGNKSVDEMIQLVRVGRITILKKAMRDYAKSRQ